MTYEELLALAAAAELVTPPEHPETAAAEPGDPTDPLRLDYEICNALGLDVLGEHEDMRVEVFSENHGKTATIPKASSITLTDLLQICGPVARERVHTGSPEDVVPGSFHLSQVREAIGVIAGQTRLDRESTAGRGLWMGEDDALVLVNSGEAAVFNGDRELCKIRRPRAAGMLLDLSGRERWYDFDTLQGYIRQCDRAWAEAQIDRVADLAGRWYWKESPFIPQLVAGLVMATFAQTAWEWRPLVALRGESTSGKSNFFEFLSDLFGNLALLSTKPSEPGLRQAIKNRAVAVLVDEFESDGHRKRILELMRTSGRGSRQLRGTTDQGGIEFGLRHICWVAAVEIGLERQPDRNRFIALELDLPPVDRRGRLELPPKPEITDLGLRLLAVTITYLHRAITLWRQIRQETFEGVNNRVVESFAVPACMVAVCSESPETTARAFLGHLFAELEHDPADDTPDQEELLKMILGSSVDLPGGRRQTVAQLLREIDTSIEGREALERCGVAVVYAGRGRTPSTVTGRQRCLFLLCESVRRYLLRGTQWEDQSIGQILRRLPGAQHRQATIGGQRPYGIRIPLDYVDERFLARGADGNSQAF